MVNGNLLTNNFLLNEFILNYPYFRILSENAVEVSTTPHIKTNKGKWRPMNNIMFNKLYHIITNENHIEYTNDPNVILIYINSPLTTTSNKNSTNIEGFTTNILKDNNIEHFSNQQNNFSDFMNNKSRIDDTKLHHDIRNGNVQGLLNYIKKYNNINDMYNYDGNKYYIIIQATKYYDELFFNAVLSMEPDLSVKETIYGNTALHESIVNNKFDAMKKLIEKGANVNEKNKDGYTPLMLTFNQITNDKVFTNYIYYNYLLNNDADINALDNDGNTLAHLLVIYESDNMISLLYNLIDNDVDLNSLNNNGFTPLKLVTDKISELNIKTNTKTEIDYDKLSEREANLLTVQTLLFNNILRKNPDKYSKFINLSDLDDTVPIIDIINKEKLYKEFKCVSNDNTDEDTITGYETEEECLQKKGSYINVVNSDIKVKFELPNESINEDELYFPIKGEEYIPNNKIDRVIYEINKEARKPLETNNNFNTTETNYLTRDIIFHNDNNDDDAKTNKSIQDMENKIEGFNISNIEEGYANSSKYNNNKKQPWWYIILNIFGFIIGLVVVLYLISQI